MLQIFFFCFASLLTGACTMVALSKKPVHSVLWLIFAFFNAAALFLINGAEFLSMLLIIVYVGAVAVLFLFVVMMLNLETEDIKSKLTCARPLIILLSLVLGGELIALLCYFNAPSVASEWISNPIPTDVTNTESLGALLYTKYFIVFQVSGFILLTAMLGAIILTHSPKKRLKRQDISAQVKRSVHNSLVMKKVEPHQGMEDL